LKTRFSRLLIGALAVVMATGCQGATVVPSSTQPASIPQSVSRDPAKAAAAMPDCTLPAVKLPGQYIVMNSEGKVFDGVYTTTHGTWTEGTVSATTPPTPSPSGEPGTPPSESYVYFGTYHLNKAQQTGCAYLVTSANGQNLGNDTEGLVATPSFPTRSIGFSHGAGGALAATVTGLSASGGKGSLRLTASGGALYDQGPVTFTSRITRHEYVNDAEWLMRPHYAFSCDPNDYILKEVRTRAVDRAVLGPFYPQDQLVMYRAHYSYCGVDHSNIDSLVGTIQEWYKLPEGTARWTSHVDFSKKHDWTGSGPVAVWEEAYLFNFIPAPYRNINLALVQVRN
jgi:hypothetical protein